MRPKSVRHSVDILMLWVCPAMLLLSLVIGLLTQNDTDYVRIVAWQALFVELLLIYVPAQRFIDKHGGKAAFGLVPVGFSEIMWAAMFGAGACLVAAVINSLTQYALAAFHVDLMQLLPAQPPVTGWRVYAMLLLLAVIPAFAEETMFRGALLHAWAKDGTKRALWHSAVLFSLIHLQPNALPSLIFLGLSLGIVTLATGSVYPAMIVHGVNNLISLLLTNAAGAENANSDLAPLSQALPSLGIFLFIGLVVGIPSYYALRFFSRRRRERIAASGQASAVTPLEEPAIESRTGAAVYFTYAILILLNVVVIASLFVKMPWVSSI